MRPHRNRLALILALILAISGGLAVGLTSHGPGNPPVLISAEQVPLAGEEFQVQLTPLKAGLHLGVLVELNRVRLGNVKVSTDGNGVVTLAVPIPAAAWSGSLTLTVSAGRQYAVRSFVLRGS